jgi:hypothetical protein
MRTLAAQQRFEEAANVRNRLRALNGAIKRHQLVESLRCAGRVEMSLGDSWWIVEAGRLVDAGLRGHAGHALPVAAPEPCPVGQPLRRQLVDEVLALARFCNKQVADLQVCSSGSWAFPIDSVAVSGLTPT